MPEIKINAGVALQELTHWSQANGGGLEILFCAHSPTWEEVNGVEIPMQWQCIVGNHRHRYAAHGVTMEDAIVKCWQNWVK